MITVWFIITFLAGSVITSLFYEAMIVARNKHSERSLASHFDTILKD